MWIILYCMPALYISRTFDKKINRKIMEQRHEMPQVTCVDNLKVIALNNHCSHMQLIPKNKDVSNGNC
jgi:hypothetical protein